MAGLKKLFNVERTLFQTGTAEPNDHDGYATASEMSPSPAIASNSNSPDTRPPRLPNRDNHTFLGIEKQFEDLHDQFRTRPASSALSKPLMDAISPLRAKRHIDVLEAIFSAHRYRVVTPVSPISSYNEDIAERNLQAPHPTKGDSTPGSRTVSGIYQEDVADRNILLNGGTLPRSRSGRRIFAKGKGKVVVRSRSYAANSGDSREENKAALRAIASDQDLRKHPYSSIDDEMSNDGELRNKKPKPRGNLRLRNSAPSLAAQAVDGGEQDLNADRGIERSKSALDLLESTSHGAKPKKADKPLPSVDNKSSTRPKQESGRSTNSPSNAAPNRLLSPNAARLTTKKNVRDLSIDIEVAAPRKRFVKVPSQPVDVPVPTPRKEKSASIAEIVNSPLSMATSSAVSPRGPVYSTDEIMNLFKQAYNSTQMTSPHPTFETLQDAIVREINSHDAFRHIYSESSSTPLPPELSPDLVVDDHPRPENDDHIVRKSLSRSVSGKDGKRHSILSGRSSSRRQRRNSDSSGRELSFAALKGLKPRSGHEQGLSKILRRRHTYAQPPSLDLMRSYESQKAAMKSGDASQEMPPSPSRHRFSDVPHIDHPGDQSSTNLRRPHSSHALLSKAVSTIFDTSHLSKWPHSRRSFRKESHTNPRSKSSTKLKTNIGKETEPNRPMSYPEIHLDNRDDESQTEHGDAAVSRPTTSTPSHNNNNSHTTINLTTTTTPNFNNSNATNGTGKKKFHTSPMAVSTGKKRISLRRTSLHQDLLDSSARLKPHKVK